MPYETFAVGLVPVLRLLLLVSSALFASLLFRWLRLPEFLGALAAGIVLGPSVADIFGIAQGGQALQNWAFDFFYWSGLSILMFAAGNSILFSPSDGISARTWTLAVSALFVLVPAYLTAGLAIEFAGGNPMSPGREAQVYQMVFTLCAVVTSVPFLTKIFRERQLLTTEFAKTVLLAACIVDLVLWLLLSVAHNLHKGNMADAPGVGHALWPNLAIYFATFAMIVMMRSFSAYYKPPISGPRSEFFFGIGVLLTMVVVAIVINGEVMVAALCAGIIHANCGFAKGLDKDIWRRAELGFVPLYFAAIGVSLTFAGTLSFWHMAVFVVWSSVLKIGIVKLALETANPRDACNNLFAVAMNTRGGPGIAMASFAFAADMIDNQTFLTVIMASFVTALLTDRCLLHKSGLIRCQT